MELTLDDERVAELKVVLDAALHDLTSEIADTDNGRYREALRHRRALIDDIRARLDAG